jgi:hypothetical protein
MESDRKKIEKLTKHRQMTGSIDDHHQIDFSDAAAT